MVKEFLKKWNTPALKKYITEHNKVVRKNIGVEIKEKRVAYSKFLKVKREDLKKMQVVDAKGKNKAELIELILKEAAIRQRVTNDLQNKRAPEGFHYMEGGIIMKGSKHPKKTEATGGGAAEPKPKEDTSKKEKEDRIKKLEKAMKKSTIQAKVKALGQKQVIKKRALASKIEKTAAALKLKKAREGKKPQAKQSEPEPKKEKAKPKKKVDVTAELAKIESGSAKKPSEDNKKKYVKLLIQLENIPVKIRNAGVSLEEEYDLEALEDDIASGVGSQASVLKKALSSLEQLIKQPLIIFRSAKKIESDIAKFVPNYKKDPRFNKAMEDIENAQDKYNTNLTVLKTKIVKKIGAKKPALKPEEKPKAKPEPKKEAPKPKAKPEPKKEAPKPKAKPKAKPEKKLSEAQLKKAISELSAKDQKTVKAIKNIKSSEIKKIKFVNHLVLKYEVKVFGEPIETENKFKIVGQARPPSPEPEETDEEEEEQSVAGPIKKVPKKLHSVWKEYMEYKVGDYYTPKDQKEEIEELVDGQKQFLEARKKRKSGNLSAAEQSKQIKIIASYTDAMRDEFNENEGFKKIYKEFAPKLLEDYEESTKAPKKEKKPKKQKKEEVDPETAKQLARFAGRYG